MTAQESDFPLNTSSQTLSMSPWDKSLFVLLYFHNGKLILT